MTEVNQGFKLNDVAIGKDLSLERLASSSFVPKGQSRYVVTEGDDLGGLFSHVFFVMDQKMGREVVAKCAVDGQSLSARGLKNRAQTVMEARVLGRAFHPNIVQVFDFAVDQRGCLFFIMEKLPGGNLRDKINNGEIANFDLITSTLNQAALGISEINKTHLHLDIGSHNVFFDGFGNAKVLDLNIGLPKDDRGQAPNNLRGKDCYASPERRRSDSLLDETADVYSFGALVMELLSEEAEEILFLHFMNDVVDGKCPELLPIGPSCEPVIRRGSATHKTVSEILRKAVSVDPQERQKSVAELNRQLQSVFRKVRDISSS